jgi:hypothetical protein
MPYYNLEKVLLTYSYFIVTPDGTAKKNVYVRFDMIRFQRMLKILKINLMD